MIRRGTDSDLIRFICLYLRSSSLDFVPTVRLCHWPLKYMAVYRSTIATSFSSPGQIILFTSTVTNIIHCL